MKNLFLVLFAFLWNAVAVSAEGACQGMTLTFNLKPNYPNGNYEGYICGDDDYNAMEEIAKAQLESDLASFGHSSISLGNLKHVGCPTYECTAPLGTRCMATCIDLQICGIQDLSSWTMSSLTEAQKETIKEHVIDDIREKENFPECLGIRNSFMIELHSTMQSFF